MLGEEARGKERKVGGNVKEGPLLGEVDDCEILKDEKPLQAFSIERKTLESAEKFGSNGKKRRKGLKREES